MQPTFFLRMTLRILMLVTCARQAVGSVAMSERQDPYLKEIIMGRCYESPPNMDPIEGGTAMCSFTVDSLLGVLESQLDEDIEKSSYFMYFGMTNYDSPKDTALFVWPPPSTHKDIASVLSATLNVSLPETSLGGSLLHGLVFCGSDRRTNCPTEYWKDSSGGLMAFWQGVYSSFSSQIQGRVRMLVLDRKMTEAPRLWKDNVLPQFASANISSVDILAPNCQSPGVQDLETLIQTNCDISSHCTSLKTNQISGSLSSEGICGISSQVEAMDTNDGEDKQYETSAESYIIPTGSVDCRQCPATGENVYAWLFWALIVLAFAAAYSFWSVRHYLPEYQRIPNVTTLHELPSRNADNLLPKQ